MASTFQELESMLVSCHHISIPKDIVVALKIALHPGLTIQRLADSLALSLSAVHRSVTRATAAGLLRGSRQPVRHAIREFVLHGLRYAFPVVRGSMTRGVPTAYAALPLSDLIHADRDPIPVWPDAEGDSPRRRAGAALSDGPRGSASRPAALSMPGPD